MIIPADARCIPLRDNSVDVVVTSPPYYAQWRYGDDDREIGVGSLEAYLNHMTVVCAEIHRVLKPTGTFWLNIGDTRNGSGGAGGDFNKGGSKDGQRKAFLGETGLRGSQWLNVPWKLAQNLQSCGWLHRATIIWDKGSYRRGDHNQRHTRRPGYAWEPIFMFVKTNAYHYNHEIQPWDGGDVWHFSPATGKTGFHCTFPVALPFWCIKLSARDGDVVLDPFCGSGTTVEAARMANCIGIGLDLYAICGY